MKKLLTGLLVALVISNVGSTAVAMSRLPNISKNCARVIAVGGITALVTMVSVLVSQQDEAWLAQQQCQIQQFFGFACAGNQQEAEKTADQLLAAAGNGNNANPTNNENANGKS